MALAAAEYDALQAVGQEHDFYTLEARFDQFWTVLGQSVLECTIGVVSANQQKTSCAPAVGASPLPNPFSQPVLGSRASPSLQSKLVYPGSEQVFAWVPEVVSSLLGIELNTSPVHRPCQVVARVLQSAALDTPSPPLAKCSLLWSTHTRVRPRLGMTNGSMRLTDVGWKEAKVEAKCLQRGLAMQASEHISYLGMLMDFPLCFE